MNLRSWIVSLVFAACVAFAIGWHVAYKHTQSAPAEGAKLPTGKEQSAKAPSCDGDAPDGQWQTVRTVDFSPGKSTYFVDWQNCSADVRRGRVRVEDSDLQKVLYEFEDEEIVRVDTLELLATHAPQLLIVTGSVGTDDRIEWHVLSELNGQLNQWTWPDYDAPAEKLLRADEDFCCKEWDLHLRGRDIVLARGIYHKGEDGNCCPSRGGVLVGLKPIQARFKVMSIRRINGPEYKRWRREPFCSQCTLVGP